MYIDLLAASQFQIIIYQSVINLTFLLTVLLINGSKNTHTRTHRHTHIYTHTHTHKYYAYNIHTYIHIHTHTYQGLTALKTNHGKALCNAAPVINHLSV